MLWAHGLPAAPWVFSRRDTSRESSAFTAAASPLDFPMRPKHHSYRAEEKSHVHHSHSGEYVVCFYPLLYFIFLDNPDYEPTPWSNERL